MGTLHNEAAQYLRDLAHWLERGEVAVASLEAHTFDFSSIAPRSYRELTLKWYVDADAISNGTLSEPPLVPEVIDPMAKRRAILLERKTFTVA